MKNLCSVRGTRKQKGFTLVEMSVVLVLAGLLVAAVTAGQELINTAKAKKAVNDIVSLESQLQLYAQAKGRFPGDCDADGVIDYAADATSRADEDNNDRANEYAFVSTYPTIPANGADAVLETDACALSGTGADSTVVTNDDNANVWLNDLKVAGFVSDSAVNRKLAKMVTEDFLFVGNITDGATATESADDAQYNAIVMHNVPQWMAIRMAQAINGQDDVAYRSRLRSLVRSGSDGSYEETWQVVGAETAAQKDAMVTVAYFFDQVPESRESASAP
jgi:prepilin-type N-terminal cleavage/methylation domain-containing protein